MTSGTRFMASGALRRLLVLVLAGALAMAGCGGDENKGDPIPGQQADRMIGLLELADQNVADGKCRAADAKAREILGVVGDLPSGVDKDVRQGLKDGVDRLRSLISSECERPEPTTTSDTDTTPTTTTETQPTTTTETQPTNTEPTTTTTTPTTPTTTEPTTPTGTGNGGTPPGNGAAGTGGANG